MEDEVEVLQLENRMLRHKIEKLAELLRLSEIENKRLAKALTDISFSASAATLPKKE